MSWLEIFIKTQDLINIQITLSAKKDNIENK